MFVIGLADATSRKRTASPAKRRGDGKLSQRNGPATFYIGATVGAFLAEQRGRSMASGDLERQIAMMRAQGLQPMPYPVMVPQQQVLQPVLNHEPLADDIEERFVRNDKDHQALLTIIDQLVTKLADMSERLEIAEDKIAAIEMGVGDARAA